jgi:cobalt-zinc-cadmium efflux system membrane fusion protein
VAIASAVALLAVVIAFRELARTPAAPKEAHGHSREHGGTETTAAARKDGHGHDHDHAYGVQGEGFVKLSQEQIDAAGIDMAPAISGTLIKEIAVPGRIGINADRQARIVPKLSGTVARINKQLGEKVAENDVLAVLESRDMADGKADYLAAWRAEELADSTLQREERLWKQKVTAEQDYLNARNAHQLAKIKLDLARQRLHTMGLAEAEIEALPAVTDEKTFRLYDIRSPISGRVTARNLMRGQFVGTEKEVFTIADLGTVWVDMAIAPGDLGFAKEGQKVLVQSGARRASGKVVALSPAIDPDTRSAKAIAEIDNRSGEWKLGDFVSAQLIAGQQAVSLLVPREAIQTVKGAKVVFVSRGGGFKMRPVTTGREVSTNVEIISGLEFAETIATKGTFVLKAELGKAEAEHEH